MASRRKSVVNETIAIQNKLTKSSVWPDEFLDNVDYNLVSNISNVSNLSNESIKNNKSIRKSKKTKYIHEVMVELEAIIFEEMNGKSLLINFILRHKLEGKHHKTEVKVFKDRFAKLLLEEYVNVIMESDLNRLNNERDKLDVLQKRLQTEFNTIQKSTLNDLNALIRETTEDWALGYYIQLLLYLFIVLNFSCIIITLYS